MLVADVCSSFLTCPPLSSAPSLPLLLLPLPFALAQDVSYGAMEIGHPKGHDDDEEEQEEEYWSVACWSRGWASDADCRCV